MPGLKLIHISKAAPGHKYNNPSNNEAALKNIGK